MLITLRSPLEGGFLENKGPIHNEPLHLNSTYCDHMDIVEDEEHAESRGFPQQNHTESQIENTDAESVESPSSAGDADAQADISGVLSDADDDGENRVMDPAPGWPARMLSPLVERSTSEDPMGSEAHHSSMSATMSSTSATKSNNGHEALKPSDSEVTPLNTTPEISPASSYSRSRQSQFSSVSSSTPTAKSRAIDSPNLSNTPVPPETAATRMDSFETLESFQGVSLEDPTWKVLPAALKKYRINNDDWENYVMFICYGSTGAFKGSNMSPIHIISIRQPNRAVSDLR
jgi:hypothetical protein